MKKIVFAIAVVLGLISCYTNKEEQAVTKSETTCSILRNEADKAGIPREKLIIPADGEIVNLK